MIRKSIRENHYKPLFIPDLTEEQFNDHFGYIQQFWIKEKKDEKKENV